MKITSFAFRDPETGWHLSETRLDSLNLLVGGSGVGKTRILRALTFVARQANNKQNLSGSAEWTIAFEAGGSTIVWSARVGAKDGPLQIGEESPGEFKLEVLLKDGAVLVERGSETFSFEGRVLPAKLNREHSALSLLEREAAIQPIVQELNRVAVLDAKTDAHMFPRSFLDETLRYVYPDGKLDITLREGRTRYAQPTLLAYLVNRLDPEKFSRVRSQFCDVFPVDDVDIKERELEDGQVHLMLRVRDRGSKHWIEEPDISDGMLRTLKLLIEVTFAAPGSVFLIDELENGMGTNCLPEAAQSILERTDCQFIITSHHPYVISNLPLTSWKLVSRRVSEVTVVPAHELHALEGASQRQAFWKLINSPEYEHALS